MRRNRERLAVFLLHNLGQQLHLLAQFIDRQAQTAERLAQTMVEPAASVDAAVAEAGSNAYVPGQPPAHWLRRVRQDAPHLLEPQEQELTRGTTTRRPKNHGAISSQQPMRRGHTARQLQSKRDRQQTADDAFITPMPLRPFPPPIQAAESERQPDQPPQVANAGIAELLAQPMAEVAAPDVPVAEAGSDMHIPGQPPAHWLQRVRQDAPRLFKSQEQARASQALLRPWSKRPRHEVTEQSEAPAPNDAQIDAFLEPPGSHGWDTERDASIKPVPLRPFTPPAQLANPDGQPASPTPAPRKKSSRPVWRAPDTATSTTEAQPNMADAIGRGRETAVPDPDAVPKRAFRSDYPPGMPRHEVDTEFVPPMDKKNSDASPINRSPHFPANATRYQAVSENLEQERVSRSRTAVPPTQPRHHQNYQASWPHAGQSQPSRTNRQPDTQPPPTHHPLLSESGQAELPNRWPLLAEVEPAEKETGEQMWQTWQRRQRLNREQRGSEWNG